MARRKRQYGSGSLFKEGRGWAIRWREREIAPDGTIKKRLCYEALGNISRAEAGELLRRKMAQFGSSDGPIHEGIAFVFASNKFVASAPSACTAASRLLAGARPESLFVVGPCMGIHWTLLSRSISPTVLLSSYWRKFIPRKNGTDVSSPKTAK